MKIIQETPKEIVIIDKRDHDTWYRDYPAPVQVREVGHETNEDVKLDVLEFAPNEYMLRIFYGTDLVNSYTSMDMETGDVYSDQREDLLVVEVEAMGIEEIQRLARLLHFAAEYLEQENHAKT